ncbi:MAG TPA: hypothetical protein VLA71_13285 [Algoriphagus sp.]|nr:hypothetical protein [Algoriphagus sp.]
MRFRYLLEDLLDLENRSRIKTEKLIQDSEGNLPISRLKKGHQIVALSRAIRVLIDQKMEDEAEILLTLLEEKGVILPGR